jgi:translation initiation factor IF-2
MSETQEKDAQGTKKPLTLSRPGRLELTKTVDSGQVRQSFSHGRSKMVAVEVKRKRTYASDAKGRMAEVREEDLAEAQAPEPTEHLTNTERAARARALEGARRNTEDAEQARPIEDEDAKRQLLEDAKQRAVEEDQARRQAEEEELRRRAEQASAAAEAAALKLPASGPDGAAPAEAEDEARPNRGRPGAEVKKPTPVVRRGEARRRTGKLTVVQALEGGEEQRMRSLASVRRAREKEKQKVQRPTPGETIKVVREVVVPETITVQELANRMAERGADVIKSLMKMGVMATINQVIDAETAELVVAEFGHTAKLVAESDVEIGLIAGDDKEGERTSRAPVVTVMGHVDHGKTSLLDALRETDVVSGEAGGITQHIGAYQVVLKSGAKITFIDTPGHAAFTEMRSRGARATDIVVLVVAADDGIMPQTVEAINHAKAANVPMIIAVNKIDLPAADPDRVYTALLQHDVQVEKMGGDVLAVEISARQRTNLDKLEEAILLQAEVLDLQANVDRPGEGLVVEAQMEQGRGVVATILVQRGTLRVGDIAVAGAEWGRVRAMADSHGQPVDSAGPSTPVEVVGLNAVPNAGDQGVAVDTEARARQVSEFRKRKLRDVRVASARSTLDQMFDEIQQGKAKELPVVVKADAHGSVEAIVGALEKLSTDEVKVQVLHHGVGGINESDVTLARASRGVIIGFNVRANRQARELSRRDGVDIRYYSIIYNVTEDMKTLLSGMLAPKMRENFLGYAEIREVFTITKFGKVAGCMVTEGLVKRGAKVRLLRDDVVIHEGSLSQLKRFKDDVREVKDGMECGMSFENYQDIQPGDIIECFEVEQVARAL